MTERPIAPLEYRAVADDRQANRSIGGRFVGGAATGTVVAYVIDMVVFAAIVIPVNDVSYRRAHVALRWCGVAFAVETAVALGFAVFLWRLRDQRPFHAGLAMGFATASTLLTLWACTD